MSKKDKKEKHVYTSSSKNAKAPAKVSYTQSIDEVTEFFLQNLYDRISPVQRELKSPALNKSKLVVI